MRKTIIYFVFAISIGFSLILFKSHNNISYKSFVSSDKREEEKSPEKKNQTAIERSEYFFMLLRDPRTNSIPENIREKEIAFASRLPKSEKRLAKGLNTLALDWKEAGPFDLGGRTRAIIVDAGNNNVIIAAGVSGGIWKSTDKGITWLFKSTISSVLSVTSIAQDPRPGFRNNWYAVGGEFDEDTNSADSRGGNAFFYGGGFYRSTDTGETWNIVTTNLTAPNATSWNSMFSYASKVIVSPTSGNVFVCSNAGVILKSTDRGSTWATIRGQLNDHYYTDLIININGVMVSYLSKLSPYGTNQTTPGLFKSTNDGSTWTNITPIDFPTASSRSVMAFSASNSNLVYNLTNTGDKIGSTQKDDVRLFKMNISTGVSTDLSANLPDFTGTRAGYIDTQDNYNMAIAVHPTNENIVFIGGTNLFRSLDGFATKLSSDPKTNWIGGYGYTQSFFYPGLHPDIHTIVFDQVNPNNGIWVGHDGGISYAPDATTTSYSTFFPWADRDNLYNVTQYYTMAISPTSGDTRIFGGTQDNGSPFFRWTGTNATSSNDVTTGDGSYAYIGFQTLNGKIYTYGSTQNGSVLRFETYSNGDINENVWSAITPDGASGMKFINPYAVDPSDENYMYYIAGNILWRNNTLSTIPNYVADKTTIGWSSIDLQIPAGYSFSTLAVSKTPSNILYLAASSTGSQPKIYKMSNSKTATTKTDITPPYSTSAVPNGAYIHGIAINPDNANEVLVVLANYNVKSLWYTNDGGSSWSDVEGNFSEASVRSATILPTSGSSKVYLIATSVGVYSTSQINGSSTVWTQEGSNTIGNVVVEYITSRKSDGTVVAATHGRGAYVSSVQSPSQQGPVFITSSATVNPATATTGNGVAKTVTYTATDADGDAVTYSYEVTPAVSAGSVVFSAIAGTLTFTPAFADIANSPFTFVVTASSGTPAMTAVINTVFSVTNSGLKGDVNASGTITSADALRVLNYVVNPTVYTLTDQQFWAADVNNDNAVGAYDAASILVKAGGGAFLPKQIATAGTVKFGSFTSEKNVFTLPIMIENTAGVKSFYSEIQLGNSVVLTGTNSRLPESWVMASHFENGLLKIAMAGTSPLTAGTVAFVNLLLNDKEASVSIQGSTILNDQIAGSLNAVKIREIPSEFSLSQNYPNPFNPSTTIEYELPVKGYVKLEIFNILGEKVDELVNGEQEPGKYSVEFNSKNLASGVYIYNIRAREYLKSRKMLLIK